MRLPRGCRNSLSEKLGGSHFTSPVKSFNAVEAEIQAFQRFIERHKFTEKRNSDISHKDLPENWSDHRYLHILYPTIVRAIAMAVRLMKRIDDLAVGPEARFFWSKLRQRRYDRTMRAKVQYLLTPHIKLSAESRAAVMRDEMRRGKVFWEPMQTLINGQPAVVPVYKKWAAVLLNNGVIFLDVYPLIELQNIQVA
jgi:hypothetical protein